jgi:iron(II)-dependent oxidoreductase
VTRQPEDRAAFKEALLQVRGRLLAMIEDLSDAQLRVQPNPIMNPFLWEIGHVAWFAERFLLRGTGRPSAIRSDVDRHWDSITVAHETRWDLNLPDRTETLAYMERVLEAILERLDTLELSAAERDLHLLVLHHEDMHVEAFAYMRQTAAYPAPSLCGKEPAPAVGHPGDVEFEGGSFLLGAPADGSYTFDNERNAHRVHLQPFALARGLVTEAQYAEFLEDDGYGRGELWSAAGLRWCRATAARAPRTWRREGGAWLRQAWDTWLPLEEHRPVSHVNAYEAEAWCRWAGRRLPTEAEWEFAARRSPHPWGDGPCTPERANLDFTYGDVVPVGACAEGDSPDGLRQLIGNLWEWTSTEFGPYPGFRAGTYREYSEPAFTGHRVLRGGCWATAGRLIRTTWRNFYAPERGDVWCGFRPARDLE